MIEPGKGNKENTENPSAYPDGMLGKYKLPNDNEWPEDNSFEGLETIEPNDEQLKEFFKNKKDKN